MTEFKDLYLCNPIKNCDCSKYGCHINGEIDACYLTSNPDFAFIKDETPVIVMKKNDFLRLESLGLDIGEQLESATKTAIKNITIRRKKNENSNKEYYYQEKKRMKTVYEVVVRETLERRVAVTAESKEKAIAKVKRDYDNWDLVLDHWSNFKNVEIITEE